MKSEETIDFHIRWAWYNISRMYNIKAGKFGGSMAIGYTLLNIDKQGTPSTKLAPKMGMEPRSLTRMIKQLDESGLIKKQSDKNDKRLVRIFLTEKGKQVRSKARDVVISFNNEIQDQIDAKELATCLSVLNKVNDLIDKNNTL
ncbi:MAG: MarR family transcriptional regulator [Bacteroidota bacterium]|nr:MarR family transcriptional regulator [Bacteroidota bacterium]